MSLYEYRLCLQLATQFGWMVANSIADAILSLGLPLFTRIIHSRHPQTIHPTHSALNLLVSNALVESFTHDFQ